MSHPSNWIKVRFEQIVENVTDRIDKPSESGLDYYIGLEHLDTDQIRIKRFGSTADVNATKYLCKKGDIIFGKRNSYLRKVAVSDRDAVVSAHSMIFRPAGDLIDPDFLPCFLQSSTFWRVAHSVSEGSMSPTIKWKIIAKQEFMIPPIEEQKKIAKLLWAIEDNIEKTENLISINEKLKKGLLNELLTKGIGHTKFKETEIGEIPEEWDLVKLGDVTLEIRDGTHHTPKYTKSGVPFLRVTDIQDEFIDWNNTKYVSKEEHEVLIKRVKPEKGDLLLSKNGTIGIPKIIDWDREFSIFVSLCLIKPNKTKISVEYIYYFILSDFAMSQIRFRSKTATVTNLHLEEIRELLIALPDLKTQEVIVNKFKIQDTQINNLKNYMKRTNDLKKKLTDSILKGEVKF